MPSIPEIIDGSHCLLLADIELVDIFGCHRATLQPQPSHIYPNETLIHHGYLGCSPLYPTVAISLRTLAAYRQSHWTCPCFSVQAQCKTLCHLHNIPYRAYLNMQFSAAYDVYLEILHCVKTHLNAALGQDTPNWRLLNSCPCCVYKLKGEPSLTFEWLATPHSDYWIHPATVDKFQNEVHAQTSNHPRQDDWGDVPSEMEGSEFQCTDRWRNAGPEQCKKMFTVFDESSIFIAACQHWFVLLACNMVRSGELLVSLFILMYEIHGI
ncbi:hypothetical protein EDB19DRAFT_1898574 [Suillus lakei]|nr:hypothetical protein EDB19DRAFT_1898574 [Suillus lakei]